MTDLSKLKAAVYDHGQFIELALRLGRDLDTVYYATNWESALARTDSRLIGEGFRDRNVVRVESLFDVIDDVDFIVFPDCHDGAMQAWLSDRGYPVWGGRQADRFELLKWTFKRLLQKNELPFTPYDVLDGVEKLREHLRENPDRWIKTSPQYRGMTESFHHEDYLSSRAELASMELEYGLMADQVRFLSECPIKAELEGGIDTYAVDGQHPGMVSTGLEIKDRCYFLRMRPYAQVDPLITNVNDFLWPLLKARQCRQFFSTEVRVTGGGESFFLEPTVRMPSPPGDELLEVYKNLSEIIHQGASGVLVEPELSARFACEAIIEHQGDTEYPRDLKVPASVRQWVKLNGAAYHGSDRYWIAPSKGNRIVGSVIGLGDSSDDALALCLENAAALKGQDAIIHTEALAEVLEEMKKSEDFEDVEVPPPADAVAPL